MKSEKALRLPNRGEILFALIGFGAVMFIFIVLFELPIHLALLVSWFLIIAVGLKIGYRYKQMQDGLLRGIYDGLEAVLILITVGALIGTWIAGGIVPSIIYYGMSIIDPSILLLAAFFICTVTSIVTGTSFGSAGTAGIAMMAIGASFGFPPPLVAGAVISGCYVGDKLSPISDTTVMTASLAKVDIIVHIKSMLRVSIPAWVIAGALFLIVGFFYQGSGDLSAATSIMASLKEHFNIAWYMLLPAVVVVVMLAMKMPSIPVIMFGALLGSIWAFIFQGVPFLGAINIMYAGSEITSGIAFIDELLNRGGIVFMLDVIALIILALGVGGLMAKIGIIRAVGDFLARWAINPGRLTTSTVISGFMGNVFGAAYVSLITATKVTEDNYDRMKIDRRVLSRNTEAGGTVTTPLVPWSDGGVFMTAALGVPTLSYLPFVWFNLLVVLITLIYGYTNTFIWRTEEAKDEKPIENVVSGN